MSTVQITDHEFGAIKKMIYDRAGIHLQENKKHLVEGRLSKRLRAHQLASFSDYLSLLSGNSHPEERQMAIDLLTTNETYFFREPKHFEFLQQHLSQVCLVGEEFRVWSAACSFGQEPYSIAMLLDDRLGNRNWEVVASDISTQVLDKARKALYPIDQAEKIPNPYLKKYCLKGVGMQEGTLLIDEALRNRVRFIHTNLNSELPRVGQFDVIFLRNVMIYFDVETKKSLVKRLKMMLKPGGYLLVGHSESLNGINPGLRMLSPSIYQNQ